MEAHGFCIVIAIVSANPAIGAESIGKTRSKINELDFKCSFQHQDLSDEETKYLESIRDDPNPSTNLNVKDLKEKSQRVLSCQDGLDAQAERDGKQTPRVKARQAKEADFERSLPEPCRDAIAQQDKFSKSGVLDKLAKANALFGAGVTDDGCAILKDVAVDNEAIRREFVACYKAAQGDEKTANVASAAVSQAGQFQTTNERLARASQQYHCGF